MVPQNWYGPVFLLILNGHSIYCKTANSIRTLNAKLLIFLSAFGFITVFSLVMIYILIVAVICCSTFNLPTLTSL